MAKNVPKAPRFGVLENLNDNVSTPTHTHTSTPTPSPVPTAKERKTRRVQLLLKESTVIALDEYAKRHDTSRNDIIQKLADDFINNGV